MTQLIVFPYYFVLSVISIDKSTSKTTSTTKTLPYLRTEGITNSTEKLSKFYDIIQHYTKTVQWWTGITRFNETHFQNQSRVFVVSKRRLCKNIFPIFQFKNNQGQGSYNLIGSY